VLAAVKLCWASLYEPRAIFYRAKKGFKTASISVIVQRMVDAEKAGVTFTVNPSTGEDVVLHEACWGLGESLVLGRVQPDRYILSKDGKLLQKEIGHKELMHVKEFGIDRTVELRVPKEKVDAQVLTDEELRRLTAYANKIEEHYGVPQDIEWCIKGTKIYIVQTRPVTTLTSESINPIAPMAAHEKTAVAEGKEILRGISASPGVGSGPVKVVDSLEATKKVMKGDVLVTEMTSPDFVPAMSKCVALITDKGGTTSHAAIVSREMGIPCVVGTQQATKVLSDGVVVTVDGTNGIVYEGKTEVKDETADKVVGEVDSEIVGKV
jgi:pyruvate,water dikinase